MKYVVLLSSAVSLIFTTIASSGIPCSDLLNYRQLDGGCVPCPAEHVDSGYAPTVYQVTNGG
jgi:hypothetical protein